ncbi:MAG: phage tail tip lysozyme, partial [Clostridia bacterium]|nr:phage tail tip lysozyme [Clostridia bacterium]
MKKIKSLAAALLCAAVMPMPSQSFAAEDDIKSETYLGDVYYLTEGRLYKNDVTEDGRIFEEYYIANIFMVDDDFFASVLRRDVEYIDVGNGEVIFVEDNTDEDFEELLSESNEQIVYDFLIDEMGLNAAAACGVLANIRAESSFNPNALGDSGTSYGICQWHNSRWTNLKNYCNNNGYDWTTLEGQLHFLYYELVSSYAEVWNYLNSVDNTSDGAYNAGYYWCYNYEIPANTAYVASVRGGYAREYWEIYGENDNEEVEPQISSVTLEKSGEYITVSVESSGIEDGVVLAVGFADGETVGFAAVKN